jgi:CheY-like chemotaxis protein
VSPLILVVDDDDDVRAVVVDMLEAAAYPVLAASHANDALLLLYKHPAISLVFTDINMPGLNGYVLADIAVARWPHLRILYTTGALNGVAGGAWLGVLHGAMLAKPYHGAHLIAAITGSLAQPTPPRRWSAPWNETT